MGFGDALLKRLFNRWTAQGHGAEQDALRQPEKPRIPEQPGGLSEFEWIQPNGRSFPGISYNGKLVISGSQIYTEGATYIKIQENGHSVVIIGADIGRDGWARGGQVFFNGVFVPQNKKGEVNLMGIPVLGWRFQGGQKQKAQSPQAFDL